ncbi:hypothetical protein PtrV1_13380 [Pyrenophora tritici-repentis]|nr:hypothetical protein PtrV1_13380 [Pyrenophora tritici-repentis]
MPAKRTRVNALEIATTSKRPRVAARHRGTASQPVLVDTRPFSPSPPPPPLSPRQALVAAPQAPNFEATLRESRAEETIIPPPEGSEHATVAASGAASEAVDEGFVWVEDKYDGFNWSRYPKHCKPPTSLSNRASWVYSHGYRIALRSNVAKVTWICHYCYKHKFTTVGRGIHDVSQSPSAPARHLGEDKKGHGLKPPSKRTTVAPRKETLLERALQKGCSQAVANELTNFNIQEFRLAAVTWLVENNLPLSQFESSSFRNMIQLASVEAERALWASYNSVSRYVIRLYNYLLLKVVASLSESMSKVHIMFATLDNLAVIYAGGQVVQIAEWGTVVLNVRTPSGKAPIKLTHVALVEGFFANVLGLSRCRPLGIHFDSGRDLLYQNNPSNVVAMLEYSNGHWLIDAEENDRPELSTLSTFAARFQPQRTSQKPRPAIVATANEAHQLWGHASKQAIDHLPESVTGFELVGDNKAPKWKDCDVCIQSRMTQQISRRTPEDTNTTVRNNQLSGS